MTTVEREEDPKLEAIPGGQSVKPVISDTLARAAWVFLYGAVYPAVEFSSSQTALCQQIIKETYQYYEEEKNAFKHFVQRIMVAGRLQKQEKQRLALPCEWLVSDESYFDTAREWLIEIYFKREAIPRYELGLQQLAEAVYQYAQNPCDDIFRHWRCELMKTGEVEVLQQFYQFVLHTNYQLAAA
jgi:hypothetical protein